MCAIHEQSQAHVHIHVPVGTVLNVRTKIGE